MKKQKTTSSKDEQRGFNVHVEYSVRAQKVLNKLDQHINTRNRKRLKKLEETPVPPDAKFIGRDKIIIAIDSQEGKIVIKGWKESTGIDTLKVIKELEPYCSEFLYTYVDKEGMMKGTDFSTLRNLKQITTNEITAAGGISSMDEIKRLERLKVNSVLGMALYMGKIKLS